MDIRSTQLFLHLASSLNFAKTSEQMFVSPSTLTRVIQRLEQELNTELFIRDKRSVKLTPEGRRVQRFACLWLDEWHQLQLDLAVSSSQLVGEIKLFCTVTASYSHLPDILDKFRVLCPKADIKLTTGDASLAVEKVRSGDVDIALAALPEHLPATMAFHSITKLAVGLIAPTLPGKINDLLSLSPIPWHDIPIIQPERGPARSRFDRWIKEAGFTPHVVAKVDGHEAMVSMVALGTGVSIAPDIVVQLSPVKDRVKALKVDYNFNDFDLGICLLNKRNQEPLLKAFWQVASR